ncbi:hypothetical protein N7468_009184 [Penicillium chermesinum]|uniref:DUF4246 domain-containing protein n=1 Tax=Penicillium chermesinum TaxID=63820 RepID=A0A9W9TFW8_9EURO|nr:uncharacterized protein N7468_009184 [Penicillium chermesinum]KAJ5219980.1 hypothetical protein N7468_009184 [Penicillium chermesinum]KAJ6157437.1 hypothetical protein N7470_005029 [Penicillium chermesinum]
MPITQENEDFTSISTLNTEFEDIHDEWKAAQPVRLLEPVDFLPRGSDDFFEPTVNLRKKFTDRPLQVVLKLTNIELTPDKPNYQAESWHLDGQLNKRVCVSAIGFYENQNIIESTLSFPPVVEKLNEVKCKATV